MNRQTPRIINHDADARTLLLAGVDKLDKIVGSTLGPMGNNVVVDKIFHAPNVTKDGVTVAKEIELKHPVENIGAQLVKEAALKTNDVAGDGTTTATVLAAAICREGMKYTSVGANAINIKRGIDKGVKILVDALKRDSESVKGNPQKLKEVAIISSNGDEKIADLIVNAMQKIGETGAITVRESQSTETNVDLVDGMQWDYGYINPYMVTNPEQMVVEYEDAFLLLVDGRIVDGNKLANVLEIIAKTKGNVPVIVIAEDVVDSALTLLVVNKLKKGFYWAAVKSPGFGERKREVMKDLAIMTGGTFITPEADLSLEKATIEHLGFAKRIKITKDSTTILEGAGKPEEIENRKKEIQIQIDGSNSEYDKGMLQERLAKLSSGVAVVKAGAPTEVEMKQAKARIEDAVNAVKAAIAEGVVPGGGSALLRAGKDLDKLPVETNEDIQHGIDVIKRAIQEPLRRIVSNGGLSADVITNNVLSNPKKTPNYGYNAATNTYGDLVSMGVIDPTKVTRVALENAASIAKMILTTSGTLVDEPDPTKRDMPSYDGDY